jgi:hypothetical protein
MHGHRIVSCVSMSWMACASCDQLKPIAATATVTHSKIRAKTTRASEDRGLAGGAAKRVLVAHSYRDPASAGNAPFPNSGTASVCAWLGSLLFR